MGAIEISSKLLAIDVSARMTMQGRETIVEGRKQVDFYGNRY